MLDIKLIRDNVEEIINKLSRRNGDFSYLQDVVNYDEERRETLKKVEELKQFRNEKSKQIGIVKKEKGNAEGLLKEVAGIGEEITTLDSKVKELEIKIDELMSITPNIPFDFVTYGQNENDNVEIKKYLKPTEFSFSPKAHWDLGVDLGILDFERAAKITGSRFVIYKDKGAKLERALANFMLDIHTTKHGYKEVLPPYIVNQQSMFGTGQLPKFEEDLFKLCGLSYYLIPTSEVPLTNIHNNEILNNKDLPIKYTAFSPNFRAEAGAAGRDTRGIIRQHQFNKVELVQLTTPETSIQQLKELLNNAETILQLLKLPYRVIELCTGDMGFASAVTYDIEVWLPSYGEYKEISSCTCFGDFQARRANIKFKKDKDSKAEFVHTINGSGLAVGRTFAAVLENYQNEDGSITIPEVLVPYMGGLTKIIKDK